MCQTVSYNKIMTNIKNYCADCAHNNPGNVGFCKKCLKDTLFEIGNIKSPFEYKKVL